MVMSRKRILVIEDDAAIRRGVMDALRFDGFDPLEAGTVAAGLDTALGADLTLVLLDLVLPDGSGLDVLARLRDARPTLPVIVLSALGQEHDRVRGLEIGADDYVVKPFSVKELLARIHAVLRRTPGRPLDVTGLPLPDGHADLSRSEVKFADGDRASLSERELDLLRYLARHRDRTISREELLLNVWRLDPDGVETRTIDMHIARLREKLRDSKRQAIIRTVRGKGYMLATAAAAEPAPA